MTERPAGGMGPERPRHDEHEPPPYSRTARFPSEHTAGQAYFAAQDAVFTTQATELSVYRVRRVITNEIPAAGRRGTGGHTPGSPGLPCGESQRGPQHARNAGGVGRRVGRRPARPA